MNKNGVIEKHNDNSDDSTTSTTGSISHDVRHDYAWNRRSRKLEYSWPFLLLSVVSLFLFVVPLVEAQEMESWTPNNIAENIRTKENNVTGTVLNTTAATITGLENTQGMEPSTPENIRTMDSDVTDTVLNTTAATTIELEDTTATSTTNTTYSSWSSTSWSQLPDIIKSAALMLGFNQVIWDDGLPAYTNDLQWKELTAVQQIAAGRFGYDEETWNSEGLQIPSTTSSANNSSVDWDIYYWSDLPQHAQKAAEVLGYDEDIWNHDLSISIQDLYWAQLTAEQQHAAEILGYNQESWDGTSEPGQGNVFSQAHTSDLNGTTITATYSTNGTNNVNRTTTNATHVNNETNDHLTTPAAAAPTSNEALVNIFTTATASATNETSNLEETTTNATYGDTETNGNLTTPPRAAPTSTDTIVDIITKFYVASNEHSNEDITDQLSDLWNQYVSFVINKIQEEGRDQQRRRTTVEQSHQQRQQHQKQGEEETQQDSYHHLARRQLLRLKSGSVSLIYLNPCPSIAFNSCEIVGGRYALIVGEDEDPVAIKLKYTSVTESSINDFTFSDQVEEELEEDFIINGIWQEMQAIASQPAPQPTSIQPPLSPVPESSDDEVGNGIIANWLAWVIGIILLLCGCSGGCTMMLCAWGIVKKRRADKKKKGSGSKSERISEISFSRAGNEMSVTSDKINREIFIESGLKADSVSEISLTQGDYVMGETSDNTSGDERILREISARWKLKVGSQNLDDDSEDEGVDIIDSDFFKESSLLSQRISEMSFLKASNGMGETYDNSKKINRGNFNNFGSKSESVSEISFTQGNDSEDEGEEIISSDEDTSDDGTPLEDESDGDSLNEQERFEDEPV